MTATQHLLFLGATLLTLMALSHKLMGVIP